MFVKSQRLTNSYLIQKTIQKGDLFKSLFFVLKYLKKKDDYANKIIGFNKKKCHDIRITVIVSKKIDKRAVIRNRIKRIFRQAIINVLKRLDNLNIKWYLVFFPRSNTVDMKSIDLENEIEKILFKLR